VDENKRAEGREMMEIKKFKKNFIENLKKEIGFKEVTPKICDYCQHAEYRPSLHDEYVCYRFFQNSNDDEPSFVFGIKQNNTCDFYISHEDYQKKRQAVLDADENAELCKGCGRKLFPDLDWCDWCGQKREDEDDGN
jgi:hypothetical protein